MNNYKPYFRYIKKLNMEMLFIFSIIISVNTVSSLTGFIEFGANNGSIIPYTSQATASSIVICVLTGFFYSLVVFTSCMNIRADRVGYIKASLIWGVIISVGLGIFGYALDMGCKILLESITGKTVEIYSQLMWIDMGRLKATTNLANMIFSNLSIFAIGFMIGAILYRFKIIYNIIMFIIIPGGFIAYATNYGFKNPDKMNEIGLNVLNTMEFLMKNQGVAIGVKCIIILICSVIGIRLLMKAPIKDYAHDLI